MKGSRKIILGVATIMSLMVGAPAFADNGRGNGGNGRNNGNWGHNDDRGHGHSQDTYIYRNYDHQDIGRTNYNYQRNVGRPDAIKIYDNDRIILNRYVEDRYRTTYPREWSRHYYGYPPTSRRYIVGYPLPNEVVYYSVPYEVRSRMRPVPIGYEYIRVDNDVLLMNVASKQIIDAITLFAAVGQR